MAENPAENPTGNPLQKIMDLDFEFGSLLENAPGLPIAEDCISLKHRLLIAMTLNSVRGAENGVRALAEQAIREGATKEELIEAIEISHNIIAE